MSFSNTGHAPPQFILQSSICPQLAALKAYSIYFYNFLARPDPDSLHVIPPPTCDIGHLILGPAIFAQLHPDIVTIMYNCVIPNLHLLIQLPQKPAHSLLRLPQSLLEPSRFRCPRLLHLGRMTMGRFLLRRSVRLSMHRKCFGR